MPPSARFHCTPPMKVKVCVGSKIAAAWHQAALHLYCSIQHNLHCSQCTSPFYCATWINKDTYPRVLEYHTQLGKFTWNDCLRFFANISALRSMPCGPSYLLPPTTNPSALILPMQVGCPTTKRHVLQTEPV